VLRFQNLLLESGVIDEAGVTEIQSRITREFDEGYEFAQRSPLPVPDDVTRGLYTDDAYWTSEPSREGGTG
jgi:TPP-dependent pyruvate/acetoin dehydrogenase alpha subunit